MVGKEQKSIDNVAQAFNNLGIAMSNSLLPIFEKLNKGLRPLNDIMVRYSKQLDAARNEDESIVEWGNRLQKESYLDNPDTRWQYQKSVLLWIPIRIKGLFDG